MPCNSCKKPKFEQAKISPLLAKYQKKSSTTRVPVKKPTRTIPIGTTIISKPKNTQPISCQKCATMYYRSPHECDKCGKSKPRQTRFTTTSKPKVTLSSSTLLQIKSIEKGWIKVPSWFKNNVAWVKEGKISESEFNRGLQSAITQANKSRVTKPIQNTPITVPVNTTPVIESIPEVVKKDCGWFGEKCAFDGVTKAFDEAGKGLDVFVKEEQKKQEDSWKWFNTGVKETQDGIANFFENEGIKQQETITYVEKTFEDTGKGITTFFENEGIKQEQAWKDFDENIKNIQSSADQFGSDVITNVTDIGKGAEEFVGGIGAGITQFGEDVQTNIGALGTGLDQFGKDLQTNVAGIGEGFDQFGKDMQKNIMILGAVGLGAVVLMGMKK